MAGVALLAVLISLIGAVALPHPAKSIVLSTIPAGVAPRPPAIAVQTGRAFIANLTGTIRVLDITTGRVVRTVSVGRPIGDIAVDDQAARVFALNSGSDASAVTVLDARSGTVVTTVALAPHALQVAVDARAGRAFVASGSPADGTFPSRAGSVAVLDSGSGRLVRTIAGGGPLTVDARAGRAFVLIDAQRVRVLDAHSGAVLSTVQTPMTLMALAIDTLTGRVFVGGNSGVVMLDAGSGRVLHAITLTGSLGPPVVDERSGRVFVTAWNKRRVYVLDARRGTVVRVTRVGARPSIPVVDAPDGRILVATAGGLTILDARSGRVLRTLVGLMGQPTVAAGTGQVFVTDPGPMTHLATIGAVNPIGRGHVRMLDARSGTILRTVTVGLLPYAVAVDARQGRALVVNAGCPAPRLACGTARSPNVPDALPRWLRRWLPWLPSVPAAPPATDGTVSVLDTAR